MVSQRYSTDLTDLTDQADRLDRIRLIEELSAEAWPAAVVERVGGWLLRADPASTRRVNSVWPNADDGALSTVSKLERAEAFYRARGTPPRFQVCPAAVPADLDGLLARRGYEIDAPTAVQTAPIATMLSHSVPFCPTVELRPAFDAEWYAVYAESEPGRSPEDSDARKAILRRIGGNTRFADVRLKGEIAAVGMGVLDRAWLGLFAMATRPEFRRRGAAGAVLSALAKWAGEEGAEHAYLQVMENNTPALGLYARLGFTTLYSYHYRELRQPSPTTSPK